MQLGDLKTQIALHEGNLSQDQHEALLQQTDVDLVKLSTSALLWITLGMVWSWWVFTFPDDEWLKVALLMGVFLVGAVLRIVAILTVATPFYKRNSGRWRWILFSGVMCTGAAWGLFVAELIFLFGFDWQAWVYVLASTGVGVGGALNFCMWKKLAITHTLLVLTPLMLVYLSLDSDPGYSALLVAGTYLILLLIHVNYWNRRYWDSMINVQMLKNISKKLQESNLKLYNSANTDSLTGLANRMRLDELFAHLQRIYERYQTSYAVVMVDLDHFKSINDRYGHHVGDEVLCFTAIQFEQGVRESDSVGRWGGEEFLLLLPETDEEGARRLAESLRLRLCGGGHPDVGMVTASFGVAVVQVGESIDDLLKRADRALYLAKESGRNRVCLAGEHSLPETPMDQGRA